MTEQSQNEFANGEALAHALASAIALQLAEAVADHGRASLAVSGGSTPKRLFEVLSTHDIDWSKIGVTLVDERCVLANHARSNAKLVADHLLQNHAKNAHFLALFTDEARSAEENALSVTETANEAFLPFDVVVLGMGNDGHTASFFPDAAELDAALNEPVAQVLAIHAASAGEPRLTFNFSALSMASQIFLHIEGDDKKETLSRAKDFGAPSEMPIRAFLRDDSLPLSVYWAPKES